MTFLKTSDDAKLFYDVKGEGEVLLFIHGWSADSTSFQLQIDELSKDHKVVTYDLRGHGKSERVDYGLTMKRYANDLKDLIEYLELESVNLIGWSMGTSIIFEYIREYGTENIESIFLLDMTPKLINDEDWKLGLNHGSYTLEDSLEGLTTISNDWLEFAVPFIKHAVPYLEGEMLDMSIEAAGNNTPQVMAAMWLAMTVNDYRDMLKNIDIPAFIVYGEESTLYSKETAEYLNENIKDSKVIPFQGATHFLVVEKPEELNKTIRENVK